ncbi:MAG TPA: ABC transporter permease subunit [Treponemataceae bacterium]|nr:ABC transporter permease subunit [Treponemataceae bacterium]
MNKTQSKNLVWVMVKREINALLTSPIAYIAGALFLLFSGFLFFNVFFLQGRAEMRQFFHWLPVLFSFFIPALTMRLVSEEVRSGSLETLITLPVNADDIIWAKFLAVFIFCILMILPTIAYAITCAIFGSPDLGPIFGGYLGAFLLAAAYCAIGLWASSITKNQIVAFFTAFTICIVLSLIDQFLIFLPAAIVNFLQFISAGNHFTSISRGIIDSRDLVYFISLTAFFLLLAWRGLEQRRTA